jgi:hypothetical protein
MSRHRYQVPCCQAQPAGWQELFVQTGVAPLHLTLQPPQLFESFVTSSSQPLLAMASQFANPALHMMPHAPPLHVGVPLVPEQALPHPPQFLTSVAVLTSHPSAGLALQSPKPAMQTNEQWPAVQTPIAFAG